MPVVRSWRHVRLFVPGSTTCVVVSAWTWPREARGWGTSHRWFLVCFSQLAMAGIMPPAWAIVDDDPNSLSRMIVYYRLAPLVALLPGLRSLQFPDAVADFREWNVDLTWQVHAGAKLKGGFSRMDYMASKHESTPNPSFRKLDATLPSGARCGHVCVCDPGWGRLSSRSGGCGPVEQTIETIMEKKRKKKLVSKLSTYSPSVCM